MKFSASHLKRYRQIAALLWKYPGLAIQCFLSAVAGGFWLVISIFVKDYKSRKKHAR